MMIGLARLDKINTRYAKIRLTGYALILSPLCYFLVILVSISLHHLTSVPTSNDNVIPIPVFSIAFRHTFIIYYLDLI